MDLKKRMKQTDSLILVLLVFVIGTNFFPPLHFGKGLGVALPSKPWSLCALFFGFQSFEEDWILSFVSLRKGPWSGFTKKTKIASRSVF